MSTTQAGGDMGNQPPIVEDDRLLERKREAVVLVMRFLMDCGFQNAYKALCAESALSLNKVDAADNIDLLTILQEFRDYYQAKFGRYPKLIRSAQLDYQSGAYHGGMSASLASLPAPRGVLGMPGDQQLSLVDMNTPTSPMTDCNIPSTCRLGTTEPLTQNQFLSILMANPTANPAQLFSFTAPKRDTFKRRSAILNLSDVQEDSLYALVGCVGVGWSMRNVAPDMKEFMRTRFDISKDLLQTFFKNRAQKKRKTSGDGPQNSLPSSSRFSLPSPMHHDIPSSPQSPPTIITAQDTSAAAAAAAAAASGSHASNQHHHHQQLRASNTGEQHGRESSQAGPSQQQGGQFPPEMNSGQTQSLPSPAARMMMHNQGLVGGKPGAPHGSQTLSMGLQLPVHAQQLMSQQ